VIARDVTAGEIIYWTPRVRFFWPLYALLYLYIGVHLKMRWIEYRTRKDFGAATARQGEPRSSAFSKTVLVHTLTYDLLLASRKKVL
jgi:hypothetical protein